MKKYLLLLVVLCTTLSAVAQQSLPYVSRDLKNGKYGFIENGKTIMPHIFEDARGFFAGDALTHVGYSKEHFLIDRNGDIVTGKGYNVPPRVFPRFAVVDWMVKSGINSGSGIVVNSRGERLFPGQYAEAICAKQDDYYLFVVSNDRGEYNGQLATINGEIINKNLRGKFVFSAAEVIAYTDNSREHKKGVLNAWGQTLIPCKYSDIRYCYLRNMYYKQTKVLKKAGVMEKYSSDMLGKIGVILAYEGRLITVYDHCGNVLVPPKEYKSTYHTDVVQKILKKVIIPHFLRRGEIMQEFNEKISNPYVSRKHEYLETVSKFPIYSHSGNNIEARIAYLQEHPNVSAYTASECYTKGKQLYDNDKYKQAIPWLLHAAEEKYQPAYRRLADSYNNSKQFQKAYSWYRKCVKDLAPGSNDYWFACMILGGMYKSGRGCEKNYDTALYYLRLFHQNTTQINKSTASEMIAEVLALKNKSTARPQQSASNRPRSSSSSASKNSIPRPSYGDIPTNRDIYMKGATNMVKMKFHANQGEYFLTIGDGGSGSLYKLVQNNSDNFVFQACKQDLVTGFGFNNFKIVYNVVPMGSTFVISKNWSLVVSNAFENIQGKTHYDTMTTKEEYDKFMANKGALINRFVQMSGGNNGGYNNNNSNNNSNSNSNSNSNDSGRSYIDGPCKYCGGGGGCSSCNGRGYKYNPYSGYNDTCPSCNGSGRCFNCRGTGKQATY